MHSWHVKSLSSAIVCVAIASPACAASSDVETPSELISPPAATSTPSASPERPARALGAPVQAALTLPPPTPILTICGIEGYPACGTQHLSCDKGLVPTFAWEESASGTWAYEPGTCQPASSVIPHVTVQQIQNDDTFQIWVGIDAWADTANGQHVPFLITGSIPYVGSFGYGPYVPPQSGPGAFISFSSVICNPFTVSISSLEGDVWQTLTIDPQMFNPNTGSLCCIDNGQSLPCSLLDPSGSGGGGGGVSSGGGGGSTFCSTQIPCSQDCGDGPISIGYYCDIEDAQAAANNGCDVACE